MTWPAGLPEHSPLGASGASRWMKCPGSVGLGYGLADQESDHAALGTAAHALAEICLEQDADAWEFVGTKWGGGVYYPPGVGEPPEGAVGFDKAMADAVQEYLDAVRTEHPDRNQGNFWVEKEFYCPELHPLFYGKSDCVYLDLPFRTLHVWDYKNGAGIVVEVDRNPQLLYYAAGIVQVLEVWEGIDHVVVHVAQPNGFHLDGPIRDFKLSIADLDKFLYEELLPAMEHAERDDTTKSGEHCRFCPVRFRNCPQHAADLGELERMMASMEGRTAAEHTNPEIARFNELFAVMKIKAKANEQVIFERLMAGQQVPGHKLVQARSNRTWKEEAEPELKKEFKKQAYTDPTLKSPAEIDKLPKGKAFTARYAFKPDAGLKVEFAGDARPAVSRDTKSLFTDITKKGK